MYPALPKRATGFIQGMPRAELRSSRADLAKHSFHSPMPKEREKTMSKELSPADVLAYFKSQGMKPPADLIRKVENETEDRAVEHIASRLIEKPATTAENWQTQLFALADSFRADFKSDEKNVGQGRVIERVVTIELPNGENLTVRLRKTLAQKK